MAETSWIEFTSADSCADGVIAYVTVTVEKGLTIWPDGRLAIVVGLTSDCATVTLSQAMWYLQMSHASLPQTLRPTTMPETRRMGHRPRPQAEVHVCDRDDDYPCSLLFISNAASVHRAMSSLRIPLTRPAGESFVTGLMRALGLERAELTSENQKLRLQAWKAPVLN